MISLKHMAVASVALSALGCGGQAPAPSSNPSGVIERFMEAAAAEDYQLMGELWGTDDGPAFRWMDADELRDRLTVIHGFILNRSYEVLPTQPRVGSGGRLILQVRITTLNNCERVVPYTVVPFRGEWLLEAIDLTAIQPTRRC